MTTALTSKPLDPQRLSVLKKEKIGSLPLFIDVVKLGYRISHQNLSNSKTEIKNLDELSTTLRKEKLEIQKKLIKKENSVKKWSVGLKVFSWATSIVSIITAIGLIASGAAPAAGAAMLIGGLLSTANHLFEVTGTWKQIASKLPFEDESSSKAAMMWIQTTIVGISALLGLSAVVFGGIWHVKDAFMQAQQFTTMIANIGVGTLHLSIAPMNRDRMKFLAMLKQYEKLIEITQQSRSLYSDSFEEGVEITIDIAQSEQKIIQMENEVTRQIISQYKR